MSFSSDYVLKSADLVMVKSKIGFFISHRRRLPQCCTGQPDGEARRGLQLGIRRWRRAGVPCSYKRRRETLMPEWLCSAAVGRYP
ncbi:hypothetical protein HPP92_017633 [Vanilla planifolia]|uniref:Uncharacterized protein n=1 Tax=Vanilla planifolia TaxID=51239 RepID=A0A835Q8B4_VANPL|nr:hypothetical protein HPP92_017633 [Vanilla planifolia]